MFLRDFGFFAEGVEGVAGEVVAYFVDVFHGAAVEGVLEDVFVEVGVEGAVQRHAHGFGVGGDALGG